MGIGGKIAAYCADHYKFVTGVMVAVTLAVLALAAVPSVLELGYGQRVPLLHAIEVDTDPENMLADDEPVRVFHRDMKKLMTLHDMVVVGVVNEEHPDGVFNPESLRRIYELTEFAKTLRWPVDEVEAGQTAAAPGEEGLPSTEKQSFEGVVEVDLIAPSTVDNIEQGGPGVVKFEWLMPTPPETPEEARAIRDKAQRIPFLDGTLVSEDGQAIALYLPLTDKDLSHRVYVALQEKIADFDGDDEFYITGLPVAEDTFGHEMFIQMAVSAPLAMLVIFLLMLAFFRKLVLIISPMIIAMVSVILTMGALIMCGFPVHIMSSMIPIFIMPIAVLDAVHIISDFFDRYQQTRDRRETIIHVVDDLFMPMLYTSLTSTAGFVSLALTPIPPVQVFGVFVGLGIMAAWALTIAFIPAYVMFISPKTLEKFGAVHHEGEESEPRGGLAGLLQIVGKMTYRRAKPILAVTAVVLIIAAYGITQIKVNDNPVKWFTPSHPIRVADRVLNDHFGGTYMAYLALSGETTDMAAGDLVPALAERAETYGAENAENLALPDLTGVMATLTEEARQRAPQADDAVALLEQLHGYAQTQADETAGDTSAAWYEALTFVEQEQLRLEQPFKDPAVLAYMHDLQEHLATQEGLAVGKSNSLADIVGTVYRELRGAPVDDLSVPDSPQGVAQALMQFQSSHRPDDLWHFVTPDYLTSSLWIQLSSGDNREMSRVTAATEDFFAENPPPVALSHDWFGLTYINVIWQDEMVWGMMQSFAGSFLVVFLLMTILFRSALWGLLSMVPLTVTIAAIYGAVGLVGKDYDMPVAVLSSLSLGLAIDFAIHFLARGRRLQQKHGSWQAAAPAVFGEPARAITRNIIVIATGFTPLLFAPLTPYKTVGVLLAAILLLSGVATLLTLPALMRVLQKWLFPVQATQPVGRACNCVTCIAVSAAAVLLLALNLHQYGHVGFSGLTWMSLILIPLLALTCGMMSRRRACRVQPEPAGETA